MTHIGIIIIFYPIWRRGFFLDLVRKTFTAQNCWFSSTQEDNETINPQHVLKRVFLAACLHVNETAGSVGTNWALPQKKDTNVNRGSDATHTSLIANVSAFFFTPVSMSNNTRRWGSRIRCSGLMKLCALAYEKRRTAVLFVQRWGKCFPVQQKTQFCWNMEKAVYCVMDFSSHSLLCISNYSHDMEQILFLKESIQVLMEF